MSLIVHIAPEDRWDDADDAYRHPTLDRDGYVHCSTPDQVVRVANANRDALLEAAPLLLLCIDEAAVEPAVRYEGTGEERYPHVYGPINTDAVVDAIAFEPTEDGEFVLPDAVERVAERIE